MIGTVGELSVWVESYIPNFRKFWGSAVCKRERMVTSASRLLSLLQYYVYRKTDDCYTVVDLQGGFIASQYVLCDIEFSHTLSSSPELLNCYLSSSEFAASSSTGLNKVSCGTRDSAWYCELELGAHPV